jgi:hypothetical protein
VVVVVVVVVGAARGKSNVPPFPGSFTIAGTFKACFSAVFMLFGRPSRRGPRGTAPPSPSLPPSSLSESNENAVIST